MNIICFFFLFGLVLLLYVNYIVFILVILLLVAFLVLYERKILRFIQERKRPNVVGIFRLVQTVYDGLKLLSKKDKGPIGFFFIVIPIYRIVLSLFQ